MEPAARQRYLHRIAPVLDHVRENLRGDLGVESLARVVHFSPYHFHRVFRAVTGETVGVFVRRARLERAVQLMRSVPGRELGRIALEAGFGSASDFSRTFRRHYGTSPSRWDRRSPLVFRGAGEEGGDTPKDLEALVRADHGPVPEVSVERIPARTVAFARVRRPFEEGALAEGLGRLRAWLAERGLEERPGGLWGISWDDMEVTPPDRIRYDFAAPVPEGTDGRGGVGIRSFPALRVAAAPARGGLSRVARVWDHLYHEWLPASRYEPADLPAFERYRGWPSSVSGDEWDLDCCIPLVGLRIS